MGYTLLGTYGYRQRHAAHTLTSTQQHERHLLPTLALFAVQELLVGTGGEVHLDRWSPTASPRRGPAAWARIAGATAAAAHIH